jgi:hypothetical protein
MTHQKLMLNIRNDRFINELAYPYNLSGTAAVGTKAPIAVRQTMSAISQLIYH